MKRRLLSHLGSIAFLAGCVVLHFYPIQNGDILPDPWEMLFDWAGEFFAMSYLGTLILLINITPVCFIAGLLDRCPPWHTVGLIFLVVISTCILLPGGFYPLHAAVCATIASGLASLFYIAARGLCDFCLRLWRYYSSPATPTGLQS